MAAVDGAADHHRRLRLDRAVPRFRLGRPGDLARRDGDTWEINGEKKWIGNGTIADVVVVWARNVADGQVKGFLVEKGTPGTTRTASTGRPAPGRLAGPHHPVRRTRAGGQPAAAREQLQGHRPRPGRNPQRGGVGGARPCHRGVRDRNRLLQRAHPVRQTAGQLPDRAGPLVKMLAEVCSMQLYLPAAGPPDGAGSRDRHDRRHRQDEQHPQGPPGRRRGPGPARRQRHPPGLPRCGTWPTWRPCTYEGTETIQTLIVGRDITGVGAFT